MKKNYNQPIVEATDLIATVQALCASPAGIGVSQDPINDEGGD